MIIAVDFDGTCVKHKYPAIGRDIGAVPVLHRLLKNDHRLILLTMRGGRELAAAEDWFKVNNIPLWAVNDNPEQAKWTDSKKVYAHLYIDDAALGCPLRKIPGHRPYVNWNNVLRELIRGGFL